MKNSVRRNRNIGTENQGFSKDNKLVIPYTCEIGFWFTERLQVYSVVKRLVNGVEVRFIVEQTRENSFHACTIDDIVEVLKLVPILDLEEINLVVLRQPKRKEEILNSVWGRLIYSYEYEGDIHPAIIIEAQNSERKLEWTKRMSVGTQEEFTCLKNDGHLFKETKRTYVAEFNLEAIRNTQLYRTVAHEIGHYVHYLEVVTRPPIKDDIEYEDRYHKYHALPRSEKEAFAHRYANELKDLNERKGKLPFDRILDFQGMLDEGLRYEDFVMP